MEFFQASVINKYLNAQDENQLKKAYEKFSAYFHNAEIQENIKKAKEEQFQEGFLRELFVNVLGYTLNPQPNYNLTTELKNETGAKKVDGAILIEGKALAVIELKSTKTINLDKVNAQAFNYKNNQSSCVYVITSNFEKLRFFIHNAIEHLEFNLFTLNEAEFKLLWFCLNKDSLLTGIPEKAKQESLIADEKVTNQLYKDYSAFKNDLWLNMVKNNPDIDQLLLYRKAQKLLDRLLFIFFSEDSGLLPPNLMSLMANRWKVLEKEDAYKPLYEIFKQFFGYINQGREGEKSGGDIFAYNGGLFLPDEVLDSVVIEDEALHSHVMKLTAYNFQSEVDVNILGHIFENSLNDIENIKAQLSGNAVDKSKSKRKKDGVFYTPKYITQYIVNNTVGKLCEQKKTELEIDEAEYAKGSKRRKKLIVQKLLEDLNAYREWLLTLTICDPACGSGAFLNQALDFLIKEHAYTDELEVKLFGKGIPFRYVTDKILENNLYGVDINEESVEIAQLSLWLRTAEKGRKLTSLNNNIKCGNSLIDDPKVAGDKAFNWQKEFSDIFSKGGFDVVIGNPPYVSNKVMHKNGFQNHINYWSSIFESTKSGNYDLYILFIEKGLKILKPNRSASFIIPNKFLIAEYSKSLLKIIKKDYFFKEIVDYSNVNVFPDASVYPIIVTFETIKKDTEITNRVIIDRNKIDTYSSIRKWNFITLNFVDSCKNTPDNLILKLENQKNTINHLLSFEPGINGFQFTNYSKCISEGKQSNNSKKLIVTGNIDPYIFLDKVTRYKKKDYISPYIKYDEDIISVGKWELFCKSKIIVAGMTKELEASIDLNGDYAPAVSVYSISGEIELLQQSIIIINSRLINWFFKHKFSDKHLSGGYISINNTLLKQIPFKVFSDKEYAKKLSLEANKLRLDKNQIKKDFLDLLQINFEIKKLSKNLKNWDQLETKGFINEFKKMKVNINLSDEEKWMIYFQDKKQKMNNINTEIEDNDIKINKMVYELYELTEEEITIVESA